MYKKKHRVESPHPNTPKLKPTGLPILSPRPASHDHWAGGSPTLDRGRDLRSVTPAIRSTRSRSSTVSTSPTIVAPTPIPHASKFRLPPVSDTPRPRSTQPMQTPFIPPETPRPPPATPRLLSSLFGRSRHRRGSAPVVPTPAPEDYVQSDAETAYNTPLPRRHSSPSRSTGERLTRQRTSSYSSTNAGQTPAPRSSRSSGPAGLPLILSTIPLHWQLLPWSQASKAVLEFDIVHPPASIRVRRGPSYPSRLIRKEELDKSAVSRDGPPMPEMRIVLEQHPEWQIVVRGPNIRCCDVFDAVHEAFQQKLTPRELGALAQDPLAREACQRAFKARCARVQGLPAVEIAHGMRRVDALGDRTMFNGLLQPDDPRKSYWILELQSVGTLSA